MSSRPRKSTATTPPCRCWRRGSGGPRPGGCGSMCATIGCFVALPLLPPPTFTAPTVGPSTRRRIWRASPASFRRTATPGSRGCTIRPGPSLARSWKLHAGPTAGGSFYDVWEATKSPVAKEALDRIAAVYAIENKARFAPAAERVEHRLETVPLLDAFFVWAGATVVKLSGKLELAKAFRYTIARRKELTRFVTDGRLEVDNNVAENAMRSIALGRKTTSSPVRIQAVSGQPRSTLS